MKYIKQGYIEYDPETRTLTLGEEFEFEQLDDYSAIDIYDEDNLNPINIVLKEDVKLKDASAAGKCPFTVTGLAPAIMDINGYLLDITTEKGNGIDLYNKLTITNTDVNAGLVSVSSKFGYGVFGVTTDAALTLDHCELHTIGDLGSYEDVKTELLGVALDSYHEWSSADQVTVWDNTSNPATDLVMFDVIELWLRADASPSYAGNVTFDGHDNPYFYNASHDLTMHAIANEDWEFYNWSTGSASNPYEVVVPVTSNQLYVANFMRKAKTDNEWYGLEMKYPTFSIQKYNEHLKGFSAKIADLTMTLEALDGSAFANGDFYQVETNTLGSKISIYKSPFDGTTLGAKQAVIEDYSDHVSFSCFEFSPAHNCFYGEAMRTSDYTKVWVKVALNGSITEIKELDPSVYITAFVEKDAETLYVLDYDKLYTMDPETGDMTLIDNLDGVVTGSFSVLCYDAAVDELYLQTDDTESGIYLIDQTTAHADKVWEVEASMSSMFTVCKMYSVTVKVADGQTTWGTVIPDGTKKFQENQELTITAKPAKGYLFDKWNDDNTSATRTIIVTEDMTFIASFKEDPDFTFYPVKIDKEQLYSGMPTVTSAEIPAIKSGSVTYDPATNTVILNAVEIEATTLNGLYLGYETEATPDMTVIVNGTCKFKGGPSYFAFWASRIPHLTVKAGTDNPQLIITGEGIGSMYVNTFEFEGIKADITGSLYAFHSDTELKEMIINGCNLVFNAATDATLYGPQKITYKFCSVTPSDILDAEGNIRIKDNMVVDGSDNYWKGAITFTPLPKLTVKPFQEGTAKFKLESGNEVFPDGVGYFAPGAKVTITPDPASNFKFARWLDDANWTDKDLKIPAKREFDMLATDVELTALFYLQPESEADWYGINGDEFVKFGFGDNAAKVARATNSLTSVKGGDYVDGNWIFIEDEDVKKIPFSGTLKDGEDLKGKIEKFNDKTISGVTDVAYNIDGSTLYAVAGSKLYRITNKESKELATFKLDGVETSIVAIAFSLEGTLYALEAGAEGKLYTASISGDEAKLKVVGKKENDGKIGEAVTNAPQSLAFDVETGELFWGAADYIRLIDISKMKTFIVGDLGQKAGTQGFIQSLHRMVEMVEVTVEVAEDQEDWGIVYLNDDKSSAKHPSISAVFVEGTTVTLKAEANDGYHFVEWVYLDGNKEKSFKGNDEETIEIEASDITYIAYFEEDEQGIEEIFESSNLQIFKYVEDGNLYIIRNGQIYTVTGQKVQ
ncbi:MAG: hypothetical protein J5612_05305, partial [Paludibacteraceae bacterium]|nr:hypothetical protein [Paludibacteraceae bacterium]